MYKWMIFDRTNFKFKQKSLDEDKRDKRGMVDIINDFELQGLELRFKDGSEYYFRRKLKK